MVSPLKNYEATRYNLQYTLVKTERTDAQDDEPILEWYPAMNNESKFWKG